MLAEAELGSDKVLEANDSPLAASGLLCREMATPKFSTSSSSPSLVLRLAANWRRLFCGFVFAARSFGGSPIARTTTPKAYRLQPCIPCLAAIYRPLPIATNVLGAPNSRTPLSERRSDVSLGLQGYPTRARHYWQNVGDICPPLGREGYLTASSVRFQRHNSI